ncbi:MAG: hypothetical protein HEEMFOPI_02054 [Holosporales bacterium]
MADNLPDGFSHEGLMQNKIIVQKLEKEQIKEDLAPKENEVYKRYQLSRSDIQKIAKENAIHLEPKLASKENIFINDVYNAYFRMYPNEKMEDIAKQSVQMGVYISAYHSIYKLDHSKENYMRAYKIAYSLEEMGCQKLRDGLEKAQEIEKQGNLLTVLDKQFGSFEKLDTHLKEIEHHFDMKFIVKKEREEIYSKISDSQKWIQKELIQNIAKDMGLKMTPGKEHIYIVLVNTLYTAYKSFDGLSSDERLKTAVKNALTMSSQLKEEPHGQLKESHLTKAYEKTLEQNHHDIQNLQKNLDNHHEKDHIHHMSHFFKEKCHTIEEHMFVQKKHLEHIDHQHQQMLMRQQQQMQHEQNQHHQMQHQRTPSFDLER